MRTARLRRRGSRGRLSYLRAMRTTIIVGIASAALVGCKSETKQATPDKPPATAPGATAPEPAKPPAPAPVATPLVTDACSVFTPAEVSSGLGVPVAKSGTWPEAKTADGLPLVQCGWDQGAGGPGDYTVHLDVHNFGSVERSLGYFGDMRVTGGNMSFEALPNIGDEAIATRMTTAKQAQAGIAWRKGTVVYKLGIVRLDGLDLMGAEAMLVAIADAKF